MVYGDLVAANRDAIFCGRDRFGANTLERCATLALYIGHNRLVSDWSYSPASLLGEVVRAASQLQTTIIRLTDNSNWKLDRLLLKRQDGSVAGIRKPAIILDIEDTSKGNLRLRWFPQFRDDGQTDFTYSRWDFMKSPGNDVSELLFIRQFRSMTGSLGNSEGRLEFDIRSIIADIAIGLVEEAIDSLTSSFDVRLDASLVVKRDDHSALASVEVVSALKAEKRAVAQRNAEDDARADQIRDELANWSDTYQMDPQVAVETWRDMALRKTPIRERITYMRDHLGATIFEWSPLEKDLKRATSLLEEYGAIRGGFNQLPSDNSAP